MTVAKAPHSWDFLVRAVQKGGVEGLAALGRSKETLRAYQERKAEVSEKEGREPDTKYTDL